MANVFQNCEFPKRTMDMYIFMNNKVVFKIGIKDLILNKKQDALERLPDGSNSKSIYVL